MKKVFTYLFLILFIKNYGQHSIKQLDSLSKNIENDIENGVTDAIIKKTDSILLESQKINYLKGIGIAYRLKGDIFKEKGNLKNALDNYTKALLILEEVMDTAKIANIQISLGNIYALVGEQKTALSYFFRAQKKGALLKNERIQSVTFNNIANCYQRMNQFVQSNTYLQKSLTIALGFNDTISIARAFHNIGVNYELANQNDSAIHYFNKSLRLVILKNELIGMAFNYLEIGATYLNDKQFNEAEKYLLTAQAIIEKKEFVFMYEDLYENLYKIYELKQDFKKAFKYRNLAIKHAELGNNDETKRALFKIEIENEYKKQRQLQTLETEKQKAVADAKIQSQKKLIIFGLISLIFLSGLIIIVLRSYNQKRKANHIISLQKETVEAKQKEILDSINYAKYIQDALLPSNEMIHQLNAFVLFKPKDIVSGDFYWHYINTKLPIPETYIAVADCTGHGVPGALVSVLGNNALNSCVKEYGITETNLILDKLSNSVEETFEKSNNKLKDGMDISLLRIMPIQNSTNKRIQWSGANNPLWVVNTNKELIEIKANKQPIGKFDNRVPFKNHEIELKKGDRVYLFTDGYADQFGGSKEKKFKYKQLSELLISTLHLSLEEQNKILAFSFEEWKNNLEQVDDVCIVGIEI